MKIAVTNNPSKTRKFEKFTKERGEHQQAEQQDQKPHEPALWKYFNHSQRFLFGP